VIEFLIVSIIMFIVAVLYYIRELRKTPIEKKIEALIKDISEYDAYYRDQATKHMNLSHLDNPSVYKFNKAMELITLIEESR
jgi:hypothetical protein